MPTAKLGYFLEDGSEVPSVTTVTSRFKESGGLIHWAWDIGRRGLDYRAERDNAADAGTLAHHLVEQFIRTGKTDLPDAAPDVAQKAMLAFDAFRTWQAQTRLTIVAQEIQLVSEKYRFGGTPDAIGEMDGVLCLLDWKTGNRVYRDALMQLSAYGKLWTENHPDKPITGGFHLCRFAKQYGDFSHHFFPNLDQAFEMFLLLREAYDIDQDLKRRVA